MTKAALVTGTTSGIGREPTILLVDDDPDLRETMSDLIALRGVGPCLCVGSLAEAQAHAARAQRCSLAILDINLGDGAPSGVDLYRWLIQVGVAPLGECWQEGAWRGPDAAARAWRSSSAPYSY